LPELLLQNTSTLIDVLHARTDQQPKHTIYRFITGNKTLTLSTKKLKNKSTQLAYFLRQQYQVGDRALLSYQSPLSFIIAFYACLLAGIIAVPAPPLKPIKTPYV